MFRYNIIYFMWLFENKRSNENKEINRLCNIVNSKDLINIEEVEIGEE